MGSHNWPEHSHSNIANLIDLIGTTDHELIQGWLKRQDANTGRRDLPLSLHGDVTEAQLGTTSQALTARALPRPLNHSKQFICIIYD